jgi:outer membrane receptor protein involved in Fe transport
VQYLGTARDFSLRTGGAFPDRSDDGGFTMSAKSVFMRPFVRAVLAFAVVALSFRSALPAGAAPPPAVASLSGTITDTSGKTIAGVDVTLSGPATARTSTQADGTFSFPSIVPGVYRLVARKGSYDTIERTDVIVVAGTSAKVSIAMAPVSFTTLRTIGSVSTNAPGTVSINTSSAAIDVISNATLQQQDVHQVNQILNEIPGVVSTFSANSTNISGGIISTTMTPQIRGALPYETESLIDGHPVSVGYSGSFTPLFINPNQLQSVEVVKGPGAQPVDINYAVGGSINYVTLQPTPKTHYAFDIDQDSYGGTSFNAKTTGTTLGGRLGFAFAYGIDGTPGPLDNYRAAGAPTAVVLGSSATINGVPLCGTAAAGTGCFQTGSAGPAGLVGLPSFQVGTYACCAELQSQYLARTELAKLRYSFSDSTSVTVAFLGGQSSAAYAQTFGYPSITFQAPPGYTGSIPTNTSIPYAFDTYSPLTLATTQGLFESELRTSFGKNSLLVRYYSGANDQNDYDFTFDHPYTFHTNLWGGTPNASGGYNYYNDTPATITVDNAGEASPTTDHYDGESGEFDVPLGDTLLSASIDRTRHSSYYDELFALGAEDTTIIPYGSSQAFTTGMLRAQFAPTPKINLSIANYVIDYTTHYTSDGGTTWGDSSYHTYAPRLAFTDRLDRNTSLRFSTGSSIAPPYLELVTTQAGAPQPNVEGNPSYYTVVKNTGKLSPESAFGYDIGLDRRITQDTAVSGDAYLTNLHGQFLTAVSSDGTYTGTAGANVGDTAPLFVQQTENLGSSRYEGLELAIHKDPLLGPGFKIQGSLERAFAYDLPRGFYNTAAGAFTTNLGVIPNVNFQPSGLTYNGLSPGRIPYSTGYAEYNYRWKKTFLLVGVTYYGPNNSYNEPAFGVVNASLNYAVDRRTSLQLTANNITSAYGNTLGSLEGGIPVPLAGGGLGATPAVTVGPSNFRLVLRHDFGN